MEFFKDIWRSEKKTIQSDLGWNDYEDMAFAVGCYVASMNHKNDDFSKHLFDGHVRGHITVSKYDGGTIIFNIDAFTYHLFSFVQSRVPKKIYGFLTADMRKWKIGKAYIRENDELIEKEIYDMEYIMYSVGTDTRKIYRKIFKGIMQGVEAAKEYNHLVENVKYKESSFCDSVKELYFAREKARKVLE